VSARSIDLDNVVHSAAESIARALREAGATVIRDERKRSLSSREMPLLRTLVRPRPRRPHAAGLP
jgi:hypothetical protein